MNKAWLLFLMFPMVFVCLNAAFCASEPTLKKIKKSDFKAWLRMKADDFGCLLERDFSFKDKKFNCALKGYKNSGDPCKNTQAYYEGPTFPQNKVKQVSPLIESIDLTWEHGELQGMSVTLIKKIPENEVRNLFKLPKLASVQNCSLKSTCIVLTGFEHMGEADVECDEH